MTWFLEYVVRDSCFAGEWVWGSSCTLKSLYELLGLNLKGCAVFDHMEGFGQATLHISKISIPSSTVILAIFRIWKSVTYSEVHAGKKTQ